LVHFLRRIVNVPRLSGRYRPELHYMRGPGPKSLGRTSLAGGKGMATSQGNGGKV
jgi:hypothetical protein